MNLLFLIWCPVYSRYSTCNLKKWINECFIFLMHPSNYFWTSCLTILILVWFSLGHILLSVFTGSLMPIREKQHVDSMSQKVFVNLLFYCIFCILLYLLYFIVNLLLFFIPICLKRKWFLPFLLLCLPQPSAIISACKVLPKVMVYSTHQVLQSLILKWAERDINSYLHFPSHVD